MCLMHFFLPVPVGGGGHSPGSGGQGDGREPPEEVELLSLREASTMHKLQCAPPWACPAGTALRSGVALTPQATLRDVVHLQMSHCPVCAARLLAAVHRLKALFWRQPHMTAPARCRADYSQLDAACMDMSLLAVQQCSMLATVYHTGHIGWLQIECYHAG